MRDVGNLAIGKTAKAKVVNGEETGTPFHFQSEPFYHTRQLAVPRRALDEGVCVTPETVEETKEDCSSKLAGELCTVSCVSGYSNYVDVPPIFMFESNESLLHIFGPGNLTCVADVCSHVPNLDNSVVIDCGDTQLRTGQVRAGLCTRCRRCRANVLLPARWYCVRNTACLRAFAMFISKECFRVRCGRVH